MGGTVGHNWREILSILIWVMVGAVGAGITWLIDLYGPLSLNSEDSKKILIIGFLVWCVSGAAMIILGGPFNSLFNKVMRRIDRRWNKGGTDDGV